MAAGALGGGALLGFLATLADVPRGSSILKLEVSGTADRARAWFEARPPWQQVSVPEVHHALLWDLPFIVCYMALLSFGAWYLGPRAYRVVSWRKASRTLALLALAAGTIDVVGNLVMWICTNNLGSSSAWLDLLWAGVAAAAWAKFAILLAVTGYVVIAAFGYVVTPPWVQTELPRPVAKSDGYIRLNSREALDPERSMVAADEAPSGGFGIAVAGGGIRSAAMALGGLQGLDRDDSAPNWRTAAKVTAVSGGAYMAGGLSVARSSRRNSAPPECSETETDATPESTSNAWPPQPPGECPQAWTGESRENEFLMTHLGYLLAPKSGPGEPDRGKDVPGVVATLVFGLLFNAVMLLVPLWLVVQPLAWLIKSDAIACDGYGDSGCVSAKTVWPTTIWVLAALAALVLWVTAGWFRGAFAPGTLPYRVMDWIFLHFRTVVLSVGGLAIGLVLVLVAFPALVSATPDWLARITHWAQPAAIVGAIAAIAATARALARPLSRYAPQVAGLLLVAVLLLLTAHWASTANYQPWDPDRLRHVADAAGAGHGWWDRWIFQGWSLIGAFPNHAWLLTLLGWLAAYVVLNPEWWSMAPFYRGKLRGAFATYRKRGIPRAYGSGNQPTGSAEPSLYELDRRNPDATAGSPLKICATATVSGRSVKTHYGIPALSVTFDPQVIRLNIPTDDAGGWSAYQCSTKKFEQLLYRRGGSRFTTMMAVGISGAAVSPAMGKFKIGPARALLALLNVRLGVWVPNPKYVAAWRQDEPPTRDRPYRAGWAPYPRLRLGYLFKEVFGVHDPNDLFLYVSDGGHWENTGLVELLRDRNFTEVLCLDADAGDRDTVTQLANAVTLGELECGVDISVDLDPLRSALRARRGSDYAKRSVTLGLVRRGDHKGLLWYAKPALTVTTPPDVLSYGENDPDFPTTSTVDQFFHAAKFTAYRDLGQYNAQEVLRARRALLDALTSAPTLSAFKPLAEADGAHWSLTTFAGLVAGDREYEQLRTELLPPA